MKIVVPKDISEKLRKCQNDSIDCINNYLNSESKKSCLISLPTGAGKSGVICCVGHFSSLSKILVITNRRAVCDQLYKNISGLFFKELSSKLEIDKLLRLNVYNGIPEIKNKEGIFCTTFTKLISLKDLEIEKLKEYFDLIIVDEGHSEPSPTWGETIRKFKTKKIIITATPYRNDLFSFDIDTNHAFIQTYRESVFEKIILEPKFKKISHKSLIKEIESFLDKHPEAVCIIKCNYFSDIENYYAVMSEKFKTLAIHEQYEKIKDENTLPYVPKNLRDLDYKVLIHQRKLDEGIDLPQAKLLVLTYQIGSGKELVQTIGRVVRIYQNYKPVIIDFDNVNNEEIWKNYREFDTYLSKNGELKKFINTLNTIELVRNYLSAFPEFSYFDKNYKKKFYFDEFIPKDDLIIPSASVCFIKKRSGFNYSVLIDKIYWEFIREGALSEKYHDEGIIVSICFNNSKFLKDSLFFEPKLEITIIKDLGDTVAIYDSRGKKYNNRKELYLGRSIEVQNLLKVISQTNRSRTSQANTREINGNKSIAESIAYKGDELEVVSKDQSNAGYAISTTVASNVGADNKSISTYYLGVASGRVSDQKEHSFSYTSFCDWIDNIKYIFSTNSSSNSSFINSFSQPLDEIPLSAPVLCTLDLTSFDKNLKVEYKGFKKSLDNGYICLNYNDGISFFKKPLKAHNEHYIKKSNYNFLLEDGKRFKFIYEPEVKFKIGDDGFTIFDDELKFFENDKLIDTSKVINTESVKLIYNNGVSFVNGNFYKFIISTSGFELKKEILQSFFSLPCLLNTKLTEKDEKNTTKDEFGSNSIFYEIDKIKNISKKGISIDSLGSFFPYIADADLMLCADMGTEPADFILSSPTKLIFVHVKCGTSSTRPESGASGITEVIGQAVKNLHYLIVQDSDFGFGNIERLRETWPSKDDGIKTVLKSRIRLFRKNMANSHILDDVLSKINERRSLTQVRKEIWIVIGNQFSFDHFNSQFSASTINIEPETLQAHQLIDMCITRASAVNVDVKFFVS